jgi:hypothetical protein
MKKLRLVLAFIAMGAVVNFSSCSKDDDNTTNTPSTPTATTNEASIDGVTVTKTADPVMPDKIAVLETTAGKFETYFANKPTESGTYTVKSAFSAAKGLADLKEVVIAYTEKTSQLTYTSNTSGTATITISGGKISIDIKNVDVCNGSTCKKVSVKYNFAYTPPVKPVDPVNPNPTTDLSPNEFKIGTIVYKTDAAPAWHGSNGYLGYSGGIGDQFKAIFSKSNPASGTYKVVSVPNGLSVVSDGEIGISVTIGYFPKAITANTGKASVINEKGQVTIIISDVTMGNEKFSAHYVIGDKNRHVFADGNLLDPMYGEAISELEYKNVYKTRIKTYGSATSVSESWSFVFYFGANGLNDGTYSSIGQPNESIASIPAGNVFLIADKGYLQYKSTATSGTVTVQGKKITFKDFVITTSNSQNVKITGEYQF